MYTTKEKELLILEIQKQAERRLDSLQTIAIAADARAMQFAALCVTAASVLAAFGSTATVWLPYLASAGVLLGAAAIAFFSARPVGWNSPGFSPSDFMDDLERGRSHSEVLCEMHSICDDMISENSALLQSNAASLNMAAKLACTAPFVGSIGAGAFWLVNNF
jgi:hypothetical protein